MKNKNVSKEAVPFGKRVLSFVQNNSVPLMFVLICIICMFDRWNNRNGNRIYIFAKHSMVTIQNAI